VAVVVTAQPWDVVPANLADAATIDDLTRAWLPSLPGHVRDVADRWQLELGTPYSPGGATSWVAPARTRGGDDVVLKVGRWHEEAEHEAAALRLWNGRGAVRCLRDERVADTLLFLLERCRPGTPLREQDVDEQDVVIASVARWMRTTDVAGVGLRPLSELTRSWADETVERAEDLPPGVDPGIVRESVAVLRELPLRTPASDVVLLHTDLHAGNVLAAEREPWLVIDPKPYVGDAAYDVVQHLLNERPRLVADPRAVVDAMAARFDVDAAWARAWTFARCVTELWWWPDLLPAARALAGT
jgi:streptomycin 6-kinase